jgi:hypothetical protein
MVRVVNSISISTIMAFLVTRLQLNFIKPPMILSDNSSLGVCLLQCKQVAEQFFSFPSGHLLNTFIRLFIVYTKTGKSKQYFPDFFVFFRKLYLTI